MGQASIQNPKRQSPPKSGILVYVVCLLLVYLPHCVRSSSPFIWVHHLPTTELKSDQDIANGPLRAGDRIHVSVIDQTALSGEFDIRLDGYYPQPTLGLIKVEGLTPKATSDLIANRLSGLFANPNVSVSVVSRRVPKVNVIGEIRQAGTVELTSGDRLLDVLAQVGGLTEFGSKNHVYVIREHPKNRRIRFHYDQLLQGERMSTSFRLRDGDIVVVE